MNLRLPGPTPLRPEVIEAGGAPMISHRGPEMTARLRKLQSSLGRYLATERQVILLAASGTGGLEAAIANLLSPGDRVCGVSAGAFGERFCAVAEAFGVSVTRIDVEWGRAASPEDLSRALAGARDCRAVLLTHNETSTGVTHPIEDLCRVVKAESDALILVDAVSSLGAIELPMDDWGLDLVVSGSQKAWGVPPGLALVLLSERAWRATETASLPRFYFDFARYRKAAEAGSFPFTPALSLLFGMERAVELMLAERAEEVYARHRRVADRARREVRASGLELFADEDFASSTVTAISLPDSLTGDELLELLRTKYETVLAAGQARLAGRIVRMGHLGWVEEDDVAQAAVALGRAIEELR